MFRATSSLAKKGGYSTSSGRSGPLLYEEGNEGVGAECSMVKVNVQASDDLRMTKKAEALLSVGYWIAGP